jgi:nickel/cobalt transporter (NiCoT) family protein
MEISGIVLLLLLGVRHGFDPDHIAIIDGVATRYSTDRPLLAKWTGTLFALGHGAVVTLVIVMISLFSHSLHFSRSIWTLLDWVPGLLLIGVGVMNFRMLLRKERYRPRGIRSSLLPKRLKESSNPLTIVLIGVLFALVFDTTTQAAAWAYTATSHTGAGSALVLGCCFSIGMITTDTFDSFILYRLMIRSMANESVLNYRRKIGWIIVALSFIVGGYKVISHLVPRLEISETALTVIGVGFFLIMGLFYMFIMFSGRYLTKK